MAGEVRKLAEQSEQATSQVGVLIQEIQAGIKQAVRAMEQGTSEVDTGLSVADQTGQLFEDILEATKKCLIRFRKFQAQQKKSLQVRRK